MDMLTDYEERADQSGVSGYSATVRSTATKCTPVVNPLGKLT